MPITQDNKILLIPNQEEPNIRSHQRALPPKSTLKQGVVESTHCPNCDEIGTSYLTAKHNITARAKCLAEYILSHNTI